VPAGGLRFDVAADCFDGCLSRKPRRLKREPRLAGAAGPSEREQPDLVAPQQLVDLRQLVAATEERRRRDRQVRPMERLQRRELVVAELVDALGRA